MKRAILTIFLFELMGVTAVGADIPEVIQVNSDISVSCFFTVNKLRNQSSQVYRIVSSSPRNCGAIDEVTGRVLTTQVKLHCPHGYEPTGIPRGGPVGSLGVEIFYQAQGMCRAIYNLPIDSSSLEGISQ
ncbi:hypothetical protein [Microbulbifer epialgicus]|uniref:Uncharacterized protein n=1 Tax=Microbulbifer epialgicus TaxID=393907 RepID=A0ABV4NTK7_9GAMM